MKNYNELKKQHHDELNAFEGIFFAFDNKQFAEGMAKVGLSPEDTKQIFSMGAGGYMLKTRAKAWSEMIKRQKAEMKELRKNKKELLNSIVYELKNHEYCITYDVTDALRALNLQKSDVPKDILKKACKLALVGVNC